MQAVVTGGPAASADSSARPKPLAILAAIAAAGLIILMPTPEGLTPAAWSRLHFEADECGSLNRFLAAAPTAVPVCSQVAAMVSVNDVSDRPARALADGEVLEIGAHALRWLDAPHVPHAWECGLMLDVTQHYMMEHAVRESESRLRRFIDNAGDALFVHDIRGNIIDVKKLPDNYNEGGGSGEGGGP